MRPFTDSTKTSNLKSIRYRTYSFQFKDLYFREDFQGDSSTFRYYDSEQINTSNALYSAIIVAHSSNVNKPLIVIQKALLGENKNAEDCDVIVQYSDASQNLVSSKAMGVENFIEVQPFTNWLQAQANVSCSVYEFPMNVYNFESDATSTAADKSFVVLLGIEEKFKNLDTQRDSRYPLSSDPIFGVDSPLADLVLQIRKTGDNFRVNSNILIPYCAKIEKTLVRWEEIINIDRQIPKNKNGMKIITLDTTAQALKKILGFCYNYPAINLSNLNAQEMLELYYAVYEMQVDELKDAVTQRLSFLLSNGEECLMDALDASQECDDSGLRETCMRLIALFEHELKKGRKYFNYYSHKMKIPTRT